MTKNIFRFPRWLVLLSSALVASRMVNGQALGSKNPHLSQASPTPPSRPDKAPLAAEGPIEARANALTANMAQALGLTPAQVEKVRVINASSVRRVEAARAHFRQDPVKLRSYIEDIGMARLDQLKDVLTPMQFTRYQRKREEKMGIPNAQGVQGNAPPGLGGE